MGLLILQVVFIVIACVGYKTIQLPSLLLLNIPLPGRAVRLKLLSPHLLDMRFVLLHFFGLWGEEPALLLFPSSLLPPVPVPWDSKVALRKRLVETATKAIIRVRECSLWLGCLVANRGEHLRRHGSLLVGSLRHETPICRSNAMLIPHCLQRLGLRHNVRLPVEPLEGHLLVLLVVQDR